MSKAMSVLSPSRLEDKILMTNKEQMTMLKIKSLLNYLSYFIKEEHLTIVEDFHKLCRKYCEMKKG
jgi:hypothetical protein